MDERHDAALCPLVVKLGGAAVEEPTLCDALWRSLAELHRAEPGGIVLVHGGGHAVDVRLARLGIKSERREGIRITPREHIDEVVAELAGKTNKFVVGKMQTFGAPAVGLCLGDGFLAHTVKTERYPFDPGCVGEVRGGRPRLLTTLLGAGFMPVLCSIGLDEDGHALNVNADEAAAAVASLIGARGLVLLTDVDGILDASGARIDRLDEAGIDRLIATGEIYNGMIPKVHGALEAANAAGAPAYIASWKNAENLVRIAHGQAVGTQVLPSVSRLARIPA